MTAWMKKNPLLVGIASSAIVAIVGWFIPGVDEVLHAISPALKGNAALQMLIVACVAVCAGVAIGGGVYALGHRSAYKLTKNIPAGLIEQKSASSLPTDWPTFDRSSLVKDCRILVIDDSSPDKIAMFKRRGFDVTLQQKVEHDANDPYQDAYDLVLLDLRGVRSDFGATKGNEALPFLKRDNPWLPVVIFTSYPQDLRGVAREKVDALADAVIRKSMRYDELEPMLIEILHERRSRPCIEGMLRDAGVTNPSAYVDSMLEGTDTTPSFRNSSVSAADRNKAEQVRKVAKRIIRIARSREIAERSTPRGSNDR